MNWKENNKILAFISTLDNNNCEPSKYNNENTALQQMYAQYISQYHIIIACCAVVYTLMHIHTCGRQKYAHKDCVIKLT